MMRFGATGIALVLALAAAETAMAQAGCPTGADLGRGIRVEFADGSTETFRDLGGGMIMVDGVDQDGFGYQMELGHGLHLMSYANADGNVVDTQSKITYDYGLPVEALPLPTPGGRWSTPVTVLDQYGTRSEPQTHVWSQVSRVDIGGCSYDMIEAVISYKTGDGYRESVEYLPQLGMGYLVWNESDTMTRNPVRPVAIRVVSKK